jgi:transcription antitermination protein NusB
VSARGKARRRALDILFEASSRDVDANEVLAQHQERRRSSGLPPLNDYTVELVTGVSQDLSRIDQLITNASIGWTLDRMPGVDREALRIGVWEITQRPDIPDRVAIAEAVVLVKELSTDESPAFVNGVLANVMSTHGQDLD